MYLINKKNFDLDELSVFVDLVFKTIALLIGTLWIVNRYYISRADTSQLKVDADVSLIPAAAFGTPATERSLLIFRLDIINTGKSMIGPYNEFLDVQAVYPSENKVEYISLKRWPEVGMHPGGTIEPGSWSAINDVVSVPSTLQAVRILVGIDLAREGVWSWHKTFSIAQISTDS